MVNMIATTITVMSDMTAFKLIDFSQMAWLHIQLQMG